MVQFKEPKPPNGDGPTLGTRRRANTLTPSRESVYNMDASGHAIPTAALAAPGEQLKVGRIKRPPSSRARAEEDLRRRNAERDAALEDELTNLKPEGGQAQPPWRRVGGEEFDRRSQLKDSFGMIWSREAGLHADSVGGKKSQSSNNTGTYVYTWGMGYHGQLGKKFARGEIRMSLQPNLVPLPTGVAACQVACGAFHTMVLTLDGRVFSWGEGRHGQLGYACLAKQETPMEVTDIDANCGAYLAAGRHHSAMIDRSGSLWCWGHGKQGQLGDGERPTARPMPKKLVKYKTSAQGPSQDMPPTLQFKQLACGARHTAAVSTDGELFTFGSGKQGQLGHGMPLQDAVMPTPVKFFGSASTGDRARCVDASATLTVVVTEDGSVYCWGMADYIHGADVVSDSATSDEFGNTQQPPACVRSDAFEKCLSVPKRIFPPDIKVAQAQVGQGHILVLTKAGDVYAWGQGSEGEVGSGVNINVHAPRLVMTRGKGVSDITVGRYHNACITDFGLIYSWGAGEHGQLGHGLERTETLPRLAETMLDCVAGQIACGEQHTAVLTSGRGMQITAGCEAWRSQEEAERQIKQQMVVSVPLGLGARELLSIGPTVRTFVDLYEDEREQRHDGTLKGVEVKEKDKELRVESKQTMIQETKEALSRAVELGDAMRSTDEIHGADTQQQVESSDPNAATNASPSEDQGDKRSRPASPVGKLHAKDTVDDVGVATQQLLQVKTMTEKMKTSAELAEEARKRAAARKAEEARQADKIAKIKVESWATRLFKKMDADSDKHLTIKELQTGLEAEAKMQALPHGLKFTDAKALFAAIDTDHNGQVSEEEFVQEVMRVCDLHGIDSDFAEGLKTSTDNKGQRNGKHGMPAGMSMSSKGRGKVKSKKPALNSVDADGATLKPTPPGRFHDDKMRAADEQILIAFFAEFQPQFATQKHVREVIRFYAQEQARKSRISPMTNATAGGVDYRELMRAEYRRQRGVDPWEWYESARRSEGWPSMSGLAGMPESPVNAASAANSPERYSRDKSRAKDSVRQQSRARRAEALRGRNDQRDGAVSPDAATKKAMKSLSERKPLSARARADGTIRPHSAAALVNDHASVRRNAAAAHLRVGSAMSARTVRPAAAIGDTEGGKTVLPGMVAQGVKAPGELGTSPRMVRRASSARQHRERRIQMTRSARHARSHTSAADRVIVQGVQDLRNKDTKAKDHYVAVFSALGPRSEFMRQAGEVLLDSRRALSQGRGAMERSASRNVSKISLLRSKLDKTNTILESKRKKLESLKIEYAALEAAITIEDESLQAEHAEEARTSTLLETVHTRLMEASENHEELSSTYTYMKEHLLSMQLLQKERTDELRAAERLYGSLVALKERGEMMAAGVMHEVKGLRKDNTAVRAQLQEALEQYRAVQLRSRDCAEQTQSIMHQREVARKAREKRESEKKQRRINTSVESAILQGSRQKAQLAMAQRCRQVFLDLRAHIGDIDVENPADIDAIIEKYKSMNVKDSRPGSQRLVNMSLLDDRQLATRRIEMLQKERDGLIELLRASFDGKQSRDDGANADFYCVSPISYQLMYHDEPLLAVYENYTSVELLLEKGEADWGFTDNTLVWSEELGVSYTASVGRNGWLTWGQFKAARTQGVANILQLKELRCGHPSRTMVERHAAEHLIISASLVVGADVEMKRARTLSEIHVSLDVISMMKPLGMKAQVWLMGESDPDRRSAVVSTSNIQALAEDMDQEQERKQPAQAQASFYALVFAIARKLGLAFTRVAPEPASPRAQKLQQGRLPANNGDDLAGVLKSALTILELPSTMLGSFADIRAGKAPSMCDLVAQICHHPKVAIRTGWAEHAETERLNDSLQAPPPVLLGNIEDAADNSCTDGKDGDDTDTGSRPRRRSSASAATLLSSEAATEVGSSTGIYDWTLAPEQMEPLSCLEELEQSLSLLLNSLAAGERLRKALGRSQEHRLTNLLGQTKDDLSKHAHRHPSYAITKATLRDYCLSGGETIPTPSLQDSTDPSPAPNIIDEAANEVAKTELRAAYLAWDVATVDYEAILDRANECKERTRHAKAALHGAATVDRPRRSDRRNGVPSGVGVLYESHGSTIHVQPTGKHGKRSAKYGGR